MIRGYVLAGGESSRMQAPGLPRDKALLTLHDETLLQRSLRTVAAACGGAAILCGMPERCERFAAYGRTVADESSQCGPLGGLDAALQDAAGGGAVAVLVVPVDLPLLPATLLHAMLQCAGNAPVTCLRVEDFVQPLPCLVRTEAALYVRNALRAGERKLLPVLRAIAQQRTGADAPDGSDGMRILDAEDFATHSGEAAAWFQNMNTPEDLPSAGILRNTSDPAASE